MNRINTFPRLYAHYIMIGGALGVEEVEKVFFAMMELPRMIRHYKDYRGDSDYAV